MNEDTTGARIDDFSPSRGHRIFIPTCQLREFRLHIARLTPEEREYYSPISSSGMPTNGGEHFFVRSDRSSEEVMNLLIHVVIDD